MKSSPSPSRLMLLLWTAGLFICVGCGPKRTASLPGADAEAVVSLPTAAPEDSPAPPVAATSAEPELEAHPPPPRPPVDESPGPDPQAWDNWLSDLRRQAQEAARLALEGQPEPARRVLYDLADRLLTHPTLADREDLQEALDAILDQLEAVEEALEAPLAETFPEEALEADEPVVETPLEEVSKLNLHSLEIDPKLRDSVSQELLEERFDIPVILNDSVLRALEFHQTRGRGYMEVGLKRVGIYEDFFKQAFADLDLPLDLLYMTHVESLFNPRAYSRARAKGLWQFTAGTARLYGLRIDWWIDERSDVERSTRAAARHLKDLYDKFGDWYLVLAAYNGGPGRIERILRRYGNLDFWEMSRRRLIPRETRNFVPSILAAIIVYRSPGRFGFEVAPDPPLAFDKVALDEQVDLSTAAQFLGVSEGELADMNPELRRGITPFDMEGYLLKVPEGKGEMLRTKLATLPRGQKSRFAHHRVRSGETLGQIARRYGSSLTAIAQVNRIRNPHRISLNQDLLIPLSNPAGAAGALADEQPIPDSERHSVQRGETLYRIARLYGLKLDDLMRWNSLSKRSIIHPGQSIRLSAPAALAAGSNDQE